MNEPIRKQSPTLKEIELLLASMIEQQEQKVFAFARRLNPRITPDDMKNPHDFPELADHDFNYEDGMLAGLHSALASVRRLDRERAHE